VIRPTLARASALNFASSAVSLFAGLIVSVVLARGLGPAGFGVYALVMAVVSFAFLVARLGIPETAARYGAELAGSLSPLAGEASVSSSPLAGEASVSPSPLGEGRVGA